MELNFFETEMKRLQVQWPNAYSKERMIIFFNAFKDAANFDFRDAVTYCLATCKGAPLLPELTEAIIKAKNNYLYQKRIEESKLSNGLMGIENNGSADSEFVKKCIDHYRSRYVHNKISLEQYKQGCDLLDQAAKLYTKNKNANKTPTKQISRPYPVETDEKPY